MRGKYTGKAHWLAKRAGADDVTAMCVATDGYLAQKFKDIDCVKCCKIAGEFAKRIRGAADKNVS